MSPRGDHRRRRSARLTLAAVGATLLLTSGCLWAQKGYDAGRSGYNPNEKTLTAATVAGLEAVWSVDGKPEHTVAWGGRVHTLLRLPDSVWPPVGRTELVTVDLATGSELWRVPGDNADYGNGYMAVVGGTLALTAGHTSYCSGAGCQTSYSTGNHGYDVATGASKAHPFSAPIYSSTPGFTSATIGAHVAVYPVTDVSGSFNALLATFDGTTPDAQVGEGTQMSPLLDEAAQVVYTTPGQENFPPENPVIDAWPLSCTIGPCEPVWSHPGSTLYAAFEASSDTLYVGGEQIRAVDTTDGSTAWTASVATWQRPAVRNGTVLAVAGDGRLVSIPSCGSATCAPAWSGTGVGGSIAPIVGGDVVYVAAADADGTTVRAYDAEGCGAPTCDPLATVTATGTPMDLLVADGTLVVTTSTGLHAFRLPG